MKDCTVVDWQRVQAELAEPYKQIKTKTRQLEALHDTIELLRAVIKFLKLVSHPIIVNRCLATLSALKSKLPACCVRYATRGSFSLRDTIAG